MKKTFTLLCASFISTATFAGNFTTDGINYALGAMLNPPTATVQRGDYTGDIVIPATVDCLNSDFTLESIKWETLPEEYAPAEEAIWTPYNDNMAIAFQFEPKKNYNAAISSVRCTFRATGKLSFAVTLGKNVQTFRCKEMDADSTTGNAQDSQTLNGRLDKQTTVMYYPNDDREHFVDFVFVQQGAFKGYSYTATIEVPTKMTYNVDGINSSAFKDCSGVTSITLPDVSPFYIYKGAFSGCTGLKKIICASESPYTVYGEPFDDDHYANTTVIVPDNAVDVYKNHDVWGKFAHITSDKTTGIDEVNVDGENSPVAIYNLNGERVNSMDAPGFYIVVDGNETKKVIR